MFFPILKINNSSTLFVYVLVADNHWFSCWINEKVSGQDHNICGIVSSW